MGNKLYIGNLPFQIEEQNITDFFSACGDVQSVKIITDRDTGRSRGFGFVEMDSSENAQKCVSELDGKDFSGRDIRVSIAKENTRSTSNTPNGNRW